MLSKKSGDGECYLPPLYRFTSWSKILFGLLFFIYQTIALSQVTVVTQTTGWQQLSAISPPSATPTDTVVALSLDPGPVPTRSGNLLQVIGTAGLANSPLPQVIKDGILADGLGADEVIFVDVDIANSIADGTATTKFAAYIPSANNRARILSVGPQRVTIQGLFCDSGWRDWSVSRSFPLSSIGSRLVNVAGGGLSLTGNFGGTVNVKLTLQYKRSDWSLCLPYALRYKSTSANGRIDLNNSTISLTTSASATIEQSSPDIVLAGGYGAAMLGPIPVWWTYDIPLNFGYKAIVKAAATISTNSNLSGYVTFDYTCSSAAAAGILAGCSGTSDTSTLVFTPGNLTPNTSLQAEATFDPWVSVKFHAELYNNNIIHVADGSVGLKFSTPVMLFGYYGNTCGDGNRDGVNETLTTGFVDVQARLSLFLEWSILNGRWSKYYSGPASERINGALAKVLEGEAGRPLWHRKLFFADAGGPSIFSPMLSIQTTPNTPSPGIYQHVLGVAMRPCNPFTTNFLVDVIDPNGLIRTVSTPKSGGVPSIYNSSLSVFPIRAIGVSDDDGRVFSNSATAAPVSGIPLPVPFVNFLMSSPTSISVSGKGKIFTKTISISNTANFPVGPLKIAVDKRSGSNADLLGAASTPSTCGGATLAPGGTCSINLTIETACSGPAAVWNYHIYGNLISEPLVVPITALHQGGACL